jgi:hypothetical protein
MRSWSDGSRGHSRSRHLSTPAQRGSPRVFGTRITPIGCESNRVAAASLVDIQQKRSVLLSASRIPYTTTKLFVLVEMPRGASIATRRVPRDSTRKMIRIGVRRSRCASMRFASFAGFAYQQLSKTACRESPRFLGRELRELVVFVEVPRTRPDTPHARMDLRAAGGATPYKRKGSARVACRSLCLMIGRCKHRPE